MPGVQQNLRRWLSWRVAAACLVGAIGAMGYMSHMPPAHTISATEDDGAAVIGGQLVVRYHTTHQRYCRTMVARWLVDENRVFGGEPEDLWVPISAGSSPPIKNGDNRFAIAMSIPSWVTPQLYRFVAVTDYDCGLFSWLNPPSTQSPSLMVQVMKPQVDSQPQVVMALGPVMVVPAVKP